MPVDRLKTLEILKSEFPQAEVGLDNFRPYAKLPDGRMFGVLYTKNTYENFNELPTFIIEFTSGYISARNYRIHKVLAE